MSTDSRLAKAINNLELVDIHMVNSESITINNCGSIFSEDNLENAIIWSKHFISDVFGFEASVEGEDSRFLRVQIQLGIRWQTSDEPNEKTREGIEAWVEAEFAAEYRLLDKNLDENSLIVFANENVSYHVWPYWREFVASQVTRMNLPKTTLPMRQKSQLSHNN